MTQQILSPAPPPAPREVTRRVRRRAWVEPRVRIWWLAALVVAAIAGALIIDGLRARAHERWLVEHGAHVDAIVAEANSEMVRGRPQPPSSLVRLQFTWKGQVYNTALRALPGREKWIVTGSILPIHINPGDPLDWTWLEVPQPLLTQVIGGAIALCIAMLAALAAVWARGRVLRTWREGPADEALVVDSRPAGLAPRSRAVRVTPADEADPRIFNIYVPPPLASVARGDALWIIRPSRNRGAALAAAWFE